MPYKLQGNCVHKENSDKSLGKLVKCHKTHEEALAHMRALYAAMDREGKKNKESSGDALEELVEKMSDAELDEKGDGMYGYDVVPAMTMQEPLLSLGDLEEAEANAQRAMDFSTLNSRFQIVASTILTYPELDAKERAEALHNVVNEWQERAATIISASDAKELDNKEIDVVEKPVSVKKKKDISAVSDIVDAVVLRVKEFLGIETDEPQMLIWKDNDTGLYQWLARYSNNFRDDDRPIEEIISAASHQTYTDRVNKGDLPYPTLQWWHIPEWTFGEATWLGYDDSGFALAAGFIYPGCETFAEALSKQKGLAVSHGMLPDSIVHDPNDPTIIIEHQTVEISPLPLWGAANKLTDFVILKENTMSIPKDQKLAATVKMHIPAEMLEAIEEQNRTIAAKAKETRETKEVDEQVVIESLSAAPVVEPEKEEEQPITASAVETSAPEVKETPVAEDPTTVFLATLKDVSDKLEAVVKELAELKTKEAKQAELLLQTPSASLNAILAQRAVGAEETKIKGTEHLARLHPAHAESNESHTGVIRIPFINKMLSGEQPTPQEAAQ